MKPALLLLWTMLALAACASGGSLPRAPGAPAVTIAAPLEPNATVPPLADPSGFEGNEPSTGVGMHAPPDED